MKKIYNLSMLVFILMTATSEMYGQAEPILTSLNLDTNAVTITNLSTEARDISSYWVCLGPGQYGQLSSLALVSGDYVLAPNEEVTFIFPLIATENTDGAGGLGLFSTNTFGSTDPSIYVDFMQWGDANQDRSAQAVTTGLWDDASEFVGGLSPYTTTTGGSEMAWTSSVGNADATLTMVDTETNAVTITNLGIESGDISSYWVCLGPGQYGQLSSLALVSGDYVLAPNEEVTFTFPLIATENTDGAGSLGLFSTNTFGSTNPEIYVDFMQWGGENQDRAAQAVTTGLWDDASEFVGGLSPYTTTAGGSAMAWMSSVGNADATLTMVDTETNAVTITNLGIESGDISSYWVCLGPGQYGQLSSLSIVSGDYILDANESVTFTFPLIEVENADGTGSLGLFSTNTFGSTNPEIYVDFMQWGDENQDRAAQAVTTGIWDSTADFISCPSPYSTSTGGNAFAWGETAAGVITLDEAATIEANPSTAVNGNTATICIDNGAAPVYVTRAEYQLEASYLYVITNDENTVFAISDTNAIDLTGFGPGICRIWGWSYRGIDQDSFIGLPLQVLDDENCSAISEEFIEVIRDEALSVEDANLDINLNVFPNPASDVLNISTRGLGIGYTATIYSVSGAIIKKVSFAADTTAMQISEFSKGVYFLELAENATGATAVKRFIKN